MQRDSRLASCDYITVTQEGRQGGGLCGEVRGGGSSAGVTRLAGWRRKQMKVRRDTQGSRGRRCLTAHFTVRKVDPPPPGSPTLLIPVEVYESVILKANPPKWGIRQSL